MFFKTKKKKQVVFETKTYTVTEPFHSLDIQSSVSNVCFAVSKDAQCKVICTETEEIYCTVSVENGTLMVVQQDAKCLNWDNADKTEMKITVFLPAQSYRSARADSKSGNIFIGTEFTFDTAEISSKSGNIEFSAAVNGELFVHNVSGGITVERVHSSALYAKSVSGNILLQSFCADGNIRLESTSGSIQFKDSDAQTLHIQTVSGCVHGNLLSPKKFEISTMSGIADVSDSSAQADVCAVTTVSGTVQLRAPKL